MLDSDTLQVVARTGSDATDGRRPSDKRTDRTVDQQRRKLLTERRDQERESYLAKKLAGWCTRCPASVEREATHGQYCAEHSAEVAAIQSRNVGATRAARRARGECARGCLRKSKTWECRFCQALRGRLPASAQPKVRPDQTVDPVQGDDTRKEVDGYERERYHGKARRGAPSREQTDASDLLMAESSFARARSALTILARERPTMPQQQYKQEYAKAIALIALCKRTLEEVCDRARIDCDAIDARMDRKKMLRDAGPR